MTHPERIGRYQVVGYLAAGGMAEILLGKLLGPGGFERPVVIKRVLPHLARQGEFHDMFLDEARIQARIRHPNVVHVDELGEEGSELYMVMEFLAGESLAGLVKRLGRAGERLPEDVAAWIVSEALAGLHAAHELVNEDGQPLGLVHRDVSPQNLFVTYDGQVKVLDFGIAKFLDRSVETSTGHLKGKFAYMSPEQCTNDVLDRRSDLFSSAIVLWELLAGGRLFQRGNEMLVWKAIVEEPVPTPSSRLPEGAPALSASLEALVMRTLSREREKRPATGAELRRELSAVLREIDPEGTAQERLAAIMARVFPDRIAEKKELLRRVRSGDVVTSVPSAEIDLDVRVEETQLAVATEGPKPSWTPARQRTAMAAGGLVVLVLAIGGAAAIAASGTSSAPPSPASSGSGVAPAPTPTLAATPPPPETTPVEATTPAPPSEVAVQVESTPVGAEVFAPDGTSLGHTPCTVSLARGTDPLALRVTLAGYREHVETVTPDVNQRVRFALTRERRTAHGEGAHGTPPPSSGTEQRPEFFRFD